MNKKYILKKISKVIKLKAGIFLEQGLL